MVAAREKVTGFFPWALIRDLGVDASTSCFPATWLAPAPMSVLLNPFKAGLREAAPGEASRSLGTTLLYVLLLLK
jgi:hypothetical protein